MGEGGGEHAAQGVGPGLPAPADRRRRGQVPRPPPRPAPPATPTTALGQLGFKASNGGNAAPASGTVLSYVTGSATAAGTVAQVVKAGRGVARRPRAGHYRALLILVLGNDFKGVARVKKPTTPTRPPKPTAATRALPSWDPRPC
jgi:hypothetical protein